MTTPHLQRVVRVHQGHKPRGEGLGVRDVGRQLALIGHARVVPQLGSVAEAQIDDVHITAVLCALQRKHTGDVEEGITGTRI